jgi:hypothetical protein
MELLARNLPRKPVRLTGVSGQGLEAASRPQLELFAPPPTAGAKLNDALDRISDRFGRTAVTTGDLAGAAGGDGDEDEDGSGKAGD